MYTRNLITCLFVTMMLSLSVHAQQTITVAQDGSGDYTTIQAAIDAVDEGGEATINIKAGTYEGLVKIGTRTSASKKKISLVGEGIDKTIITAAYGKNAIGNKDVRDYATLGIFAPDFYAENLTVQNTAGASGGQGLAVHVDGDRATFYRCKIAGYQDTHRTKKSTRSYYKKCVIEGATDFIYAGGTCWFEDCTLNCVASGYITAPEDIVAYTTAEDGTKIWLGFIFNNCTVTKGSGVSDGSVYLGRCWGAEKCGSLFMNCNLGAIINKAGWSEMGGNDGNKSYYAEYKNVDANGDLVNTSNRISWSHQLTDADYGKVSTWAKVDALFRSTTNNSTAFNPEDVIADHHKTTADDYTDIEEGKLLAFPTARGFGKYVSGGRGGKVVEVTTLDDSGEGSLRWALTEAGKENAIIVFKVSGIITIGPNPSRPSENSIRANLKNVTIAGQTAPGKGILLRGGKLNLGGSNNVIIRNIRGRLGVNEDETKTKAQNFIAGGSIGIENATNIIIDHCCFGWSGEENMTMYDNHFTTVQWCIVHEGLYDAGHPKGARGYGCQWGGSPATFHHNLLAHNDSRSPRINGASNVDQDRNVFLEYTNNVNYNWGRQNSCYGGENEAGTYSSHECNFAGNYYKAGPARSVTNTNYFIEMSAARSGKTLVGPSIWYLDGNVMDGKTSATNDNWTAISNKTGYAIVSTDESVPSMKSSTWIYPSDRYTRKKESRFDNYDDYRTPLESAQDAYLHVLAKAGTINRDDVENRIISEVTTGTAKYKGAGANKGGIIDTPADCEGYVDYPAATAYTDNDHDGMDDAWEEANGFDPTNADDRNVVASKEGYTALEVYLNSLMGEKIGIIATGISELPVDNSLKDTAIYTLNGVKVSSMQGAGIYIVRETYADNSVKTRKVFRKK